MSTTPAPMERGSIVVFTTGQHNLLRAMNEALHHPDITIESGGLLSAVRRRLRPGEVGIVHLNWATEIVATPNPVRAMARVSRQVLLLARLRLRGYHVVWTVHNDLNHERLHVTLERVYQWLLASCFAERIVALSELSGSRLRHRWGRSVGEKVRVIPLCTAEGVLGPPLDALDARNQLGLDPDRTVLLLFGHVRRYKGLEMLSEALSGLGEHQSPAYQLCVVGRPGDAEAEATARRMAAKLDDVVLELRHVLDPEVRRWVSAADWLVLPYSDVLNSGVAMLALTYRVPVIAPAIGALPEVLGARGQVGGVLYDPADPVGLREAIRRALESSPVERAGMCAVLEDASQRYAPSLVGERLVALYQEVGKGSRCRSSGVGSTPT